MAGRYDHINDTAIQGQDSLFFNTVVSSAVSPSSSLQAVGTPMQEEVKERQAGESCSGHWTAPNHVLYQLAHTALLIAFLAPHSTRGFLFFHGTLVLGFLLLSTWAWVVLCAPDMFSWNFSFTLINTIQCFLILYHLRPVKFPKELEDIYGTIFAPFKVSRTQFKKLVSCEHCSLVTLRHGEAYATQEVTKTDRLGLLISGTAHVTSNGQFLHYIQEKQFLDSPEFESTTHGDEKFHVSIVGAVTSQYICWQRQGLEYLFAKEPYLGTVMGHIVGRDITNKLYLLNEKLKIQKGIRVDIRLPNVTSASISGVDLRTMSVSYPSNHNHAVAPLVGREQEAGPEEVLGEEQDPEEEEPEEIEDDYYVNASEKSTLMFSGGGGAPHSNLQIQLSNSTQSSMSSK